MILMLMYTHSNYLIILIEKLYSDLSIWIYKNYFIVYFILQEKSSVVKYFLYINSLSASVKLLSQKKACAIKIVPGLFVCFHKVIDWYQG